MTFTQARAAAEDLNIKDISAMFKKALFIAEQNRDGLNVVQYAEGLISLDKVKDLCATNILLTQSESDQEQQQE